MLTLRLRPRSRDRYWARALARACLTIALPWSVAVAQVLDHPLTHLLHSHWSSREGLPTSNYSRLARTGDGYLWLGSTRGLVRFDGVRFVTVDSSRAPLMQMSSRVSYSMLDDFHPLPARMQSLGLTVPLLVERDGSMWVSTPDGRLLRYADGTFQLVLAHDSTVGRFTEMVRDGAGRLWLVGSLGARLYAFRDGRLLPPDLPADVQHARIRGIVADTGTGLWISPWNDDLLHVVGDRVERFQQPNAGPLPTSVPLLQTPDGEFWVQGRFLYRLVGRRWIPTPSAHASRLAVNGVARLPDGAVIIATRADGLVRWKDGVVTRLTERDGLSSESVRDLLLDEESNLWVLTDAGLDRLRAAPFTTISARNGLPLGAPATLRFQGNGVLWASSGALTATVTAIDLDRLAAGAPSTVATIVSPPPAGFYTPFTALPGGRMLLQENTGALAAWDRGRLIPFLVRDGPAAASTIAYTTRDSTVWVGFGTQGFGRVVRGAFLPIRADELRGAGVDALAESEDGTLWAASRARAVLIAIDEGRVVRRIGAAEGLTEPVVALAAGGGDTLFAAGLSGTLMRIAAGRVHRMVSPEGARIMRASSPTLVADAHALWLFSSDGIASIPRAALIGTDTIVPRLYDALDGLAVARVGRARFGSVATDSSGRIWVSTPAGLAVVDPSTLQLNEYATRVHIEDVIASGIRLAPNARGAFEIPPNPNRLEIHFTATALRIPERVRLQYRLEGVDRDWVTSGGTRTASYTNPPPGRYTFRVRAWNEDGIPAANEGVLSLRVLPAWYQTVWASLAGVLLLLGAGSLGAWRWQHARAAAREARLHERYKATLEERTRVAREMHDTLLNGFTGITLQLQGLQDTMRNAPQQASDRLERILRRADESLRDARQAIWDMRRSADPDEPLSEALAHAAREVVEGSPIRVQVVVSGTARPLTPMVEDTLRRVGREAVRNAARHAGARMVQLELAYGKQDVQLVVRDDGRGLDEGAAEAARAAGHYGLSGMRERAEAAGGSLEVVGVADEGTTVALSIPVTKE